NNGTEKNRVGKIEIIKTDTNAAPDDTPIIPGSASGLRMTACNSAPDTDKAAPVNNPMIIRGKRKSLITSTSFELPVNKPFTRSNIDTSMLPVTAEYKIVNTNNTITTTKLMTFFPIRPNFLFYTSITYYSS